MWIKQIRRIFLTALLALASGHANASAGDWVTQDQVQARLVSSVTATGQLEVLPVAIEVKLEPGWKTYWRSPGDAGLPPAFIPADNTDIASHALKFPTPERFSLVGLHTFGYEKHVVFPLDITPSEVGADTTVSGTLDILVCEELCIPYYMDLSLTLPAGPASLSEHAHIVNRAAMAMPIDPERAGFELTALSAAADGSGSSLSVDVRSDVVLTRPDVYLESDIPLNLELPKVVLSADKLSANVTYYTDLGLSELTELSSQPLTLTIVDGNRAAEVASQVSFAETFSSSGSSMLMWMIALALAGGLILNIMPCVLPVLALKLSHVVEMSGETSRRIRSGFLATSAGILFSFLLIALVLIALKSAGQSIGWGIQFQQPVFIAFLAVVVTLFAANLFGLFEISLPHWMSGLLGRQSAGNQQSLVSDFGSGALATLLATPCSAPFLGTAVSFALSRGAIDIIAIFTALGIGLALPWLAVAAFPRLANCLPKPGAWMLWVKYVMGILLVGTAIWLVSILYGQQGMRTAMVAGGMLLGILLLAGAHKSGLGLKGVRPAAVIAAMSVVLLVLVAGHKQESPETSEVAMDWQPLDRQAIRGLIAQGKVVFVDVTADWCLTCKANKTLVLTREPVLTGLESTELMIGDWTLPNDAITQYLESHGRYGIPFNAVYGPGAPQGIVLPEILTAESVLSAIDAARRTETASATE